MDVTKSLNDTFLDTTYIKSKASEIKDSVIENTAKATETVKKTFLRINDTTIIFGLFFVILISVIVAYGLYYLISVKLFYNIKNSVTDTYTPIYGNVLTTIPIKFDNTGNGLRRSYMFWIYLNDLNRGLNQYKHVLHIGNISDDIRNQSPYIFLDKLENKLIVYFGSTKLLPDKIANLSELTDKDKLKKILERSIIIPYIPLQRWVHIGIVVNDSSSGISITTYVDADISNHVKNGDSLLSTKLNGIDDLYTVNKDSKLSFDNIELNKTGNLIIGGNENPDHGFNGLLSKFVTTNYDLNQRDIYNNYNEGPVNNLLLSLGIPNYGIRNPIYRIDENTTKITTSPF